MSKCYGYVKDRWAEKGEEKEWNSAAEEGQGGEAKRMAKERNGAEWLASQRKRIDSDSIGEAWNEQSRQGYARNSMEE